MTESRMAMLEEEEPSLTMHMVPFTQYLLPRGEKQQLHLPVDERTFLKAQQILAEGYVFEVEILRDGYVSATIMDPILEMDVDIELMPNDRRCPAKTIEMIMRFQPKPKSEREIPDDANDGQHASSS